jgi:protocatechuate 3,4-dioxygenase beta subunit
MRPGILAWIIFASGCAFAEERATATGKVTDAAGKPLVHATVFIYEGHVRTGYGIYCPTCWADCGKHSSTDANGNFSIAGLNPELRFKLMVVKEGYGSAFIDQVDPQKGPAKVASLKERPPVEDPSQVVRGRVVDAQGKPVKDAVVEQEGVGFQGRGGMGHAFGPRDWIDLIAVTNDKGEFEMAYCKPAVEMILRVSPRGMAQKLFTEPTGPDRKTMTVTDGATIFGRVLQPDGKPAANVEIGVMAHSRAAGTGFPEMVIGTREDGTFAMTNVPVGRVLYLYPKMESLAPLGFAGNPEPLETKDDGQEIHMGTIQLQPSYALRGKVVLSDGAPVGKEMRVTIGADTVMDSQMVMLGPDGTFEFKGLTKGIYSLMPGVRNYKLPDGETGEVLVDRDGKNVVLRVEPRPVRQ